jgi:hypothetical protein
MSPFENLKNEWRKALRNPWYVGAWVVLIGLFAYSCESNADVLGAEVRVYGELQHITNDTDSIQLGFSLEWQPYIAVDLSTGIKRVAWRVESEPEWKMDEWQGGSIAAVRAYPFGDRFKVRPLLTWVHMSDVARGEPFNDKEEPTSDYAGVGVTAVWKQLEFDITLGMSGRECNLFNCASGSRTTEGQVRFRGYFWSF